MKLFHVKVLYLFIFIQIFHVTISAQALKVDWAFHLESDSLVYISQINTDQYENVYVGSLFADTIYPNTAIDLQDTSIRNTSNDAFAFLLKKFSPDGTLIWKKQFDIIDANTQGGTNLSFSRNLEIDKDNNLILSGSFEGEISFDTNVFSSEPSNGRSAFILKLDSAGNLLWFKNHDGFWSNIFQHEIDLQKNIYTVGSYIQSIDLNPDTAITSNYFSNGFNSFIQKFDPNGNLLWHKELHASIVSEAVSLHLDHSGNPILCGFFSDTLEIGDFNLISEGSVDAYIAKFSGDGETSWAKSFGGNGADRSSFISLLQDNAIVFLVYFEDTLNLSQINKTFYANGNNNSIALLKLNASGNLTDAQQFDNSPNYFAYLYAGLDDDLYLVGTFTDSIDFDLDPIQENYVHSSGLNDAFISKLNTNLELEWVQTIGGEYEDAAGQFYISDQSDIYFSGTFRNNVSLDLDSTNVYNFETDNLWIDAYLLKMNELIPVNVVENDNAEEVFSIYPNPAHEAVLIQTKGQLSEKTFVTIYNSKGNLVKTLNFVNSNSFLDISDLPAGSYWLSLNLNGKEYTEQLIIY